MQCAGKSTATVAATLRVQMSGSISVGSSSGARELFTRCDTGRRWRTSETGRLIKAAGNRQSLIQVTSILARPPEAHPLRNVCGGRWVHTLPAAPGAPMSLPPMRTSALLNRRRCPGQFDRKKSKDGRGWREAAPKIGSYGPSRPPKMSSRYRNASCLVRSGSALAGCELTDDL